MDNAEASVRGAYFFIVGPTNFDVGPDSRFVLLNRATTQEGEIAPIVVVQNWLQELKRLMPAK